MGSDQSTHCDHSSSGVPAGLASEQRTPTTTRHASRQASFPGIFIVAMVNGKLFDWCNTFRKWIIVLVMAPVRLRCSCYATVQLPENVETRGVWTLERRKLWAHQSESHQTLSFTGGEEGAQLPPRRDLQHNQIFGLRASESVAISARAKGFNRTRRRKYPM